MKILSRALILFTWLIGSVCSLSASANVSGDVRGVTFFYLDGVHQDFPWVLNNQYDPEVRRKIDNILKEYRSAGVNWIRILIGADHFPNQEEMYPVPSQSMIDKVNDFMEITRIGENAGQFTIELVLVPKMKSNGEFHDQSPYDNDKTWYSSWIGGLNYTNLGMIMLGGDLSPCLNDGCEKIGLTKNHANWIRAMWAWKEQLYPSLNMTYEVIGNQNNDTRLIKSLAGWVERNTPTVPVIAASIYINLPNGSNWEAYASTATKILDAYHSATSKPLWIDEFGKSIGDIWNESDQKAAFDGFLGASVCMRNRQYPKFAWVGGNDYPYDGRLWFGMVSAFNADAEPAMRPAWSSVAQYYNLQQCP
ncbi:hypothetical protein [Hahella sp. NBU794]|uniref:hypothetical protein n=1 Tax=Hahella sp. NBU794 TaxID=3422590 RepID=UPI003D6E9B54